MRKAKSVCKRADLPDQRVGRQEGAHMEVTERVDEYHRGVGKRAALAAEPAAAAEADGELRGEQR